MPGSPVRVNFTTVATATTVLGRPCYLTALSIVHLTTETGFVNVYDASSTVDVTVAAAAATVPNFFFAIEAGAADSYGLGNGLALKKGLVIGNSLTNSGTSTAGPTMNVSVIIE